MLRIGVDMQNIWESIWLLKFDMWKAHKILKNGDALVQLEFVNNLRLFIQYIKNQQLIFAIMSQNIPHMHLRGCSNLGCIGTQTKRTQR